MSEEIRADNEAGEFAEFEIVRSPIIKGRPHHLYLTERIIRAIPDMVNVLGKEPRHIASFFGCSEEWLLTTCKKYGIHFKPQFKAEVHVGK